MAKLRTQAARDRLLRRVRRQRLKYITILPSLITILNGICGFTSIIFAGRAAAMDTGQFSYHRLELPYFAASGYMILLAMIADMLDGRLARMSKSTSSFGGQLDSLCDIISFGVAPAYLMLKLLEYEFGLVEFNPAVWHLLQRFIWLTAAAYMICAAIRLARFNVENEEDESAHMSFIGLPTPAAAGVLVSLVIFHQESLPSLSSGNAGGYLPFLENAIIYSLPFLLVGLGFLMVSRIRYPHILNQYIRGRKPFAYFMRVLVALGLIVWSRQAALLIIFCGFAASGFLKWFYYRVLKKNRLAQPLNLERRVCNK